MADSENQIDVSLSLLGSDSPVVLESLVQNLKVIADTLESLKVGMQGRAAPTVMGGYTFSQPPDTALSLPSRAEAAPSAMDQDTLPSIAPDSSPSPTEAFFKRRVAAKRQELDARHLEDTGSFFDQMGEYLKAPAQATTREVGGFLGGITDTRAMLGTLGDLAQSGASKVWDGLRGVDPNAPEGTPTPSAFSQARNIGINLAGAPWVFQNMMKVLPTTLPMLADPRALTQIGGETGRDTMGQTHIGPIPLPFALPYTSSAASFGRDQALSSFWEGLATPGVSGKDIMNIRSNLASLGWGANDSDLNTMTSKMKSIVQHEKGLDIGTTTAMLDKSVRWGGHSLNEFTTAVRAFAPAARAAKMSIGEFQKAVSDAGGIASTMGADYLRGIKQATQFSQMTGLPPQIYGQFLQNPWVQANLMGTTGALPWEQGLLGPDTTMLSGLNVANMLTQTFMNARPHGLNYRDASGRKVSLSSFQLGTAGAAHVLGMSPQELRKLENNRKLLPVRARTWDDISHYAQDVQGGADPRQKWLHLQKEIFAGNYIANDPGNQKMARKLTDIYNKTKGDPAKRASETHKMLEDVMSKSAGVSSNPNQVVISLSGEARNYFRLNHPSGQSKRAANSGSSIALNQQGMYGTPSPVPFDPYRYAADPYNPDTGTGYSPTGQLPTP